MIEFKEIWEKQFEFEDKFFKSKNIDINNIDISEKIKWSKEFFQHLVVELSNTIENMHYKMHRHSDITVNEYNIKEDLIDSFKLLLAYSQLWFTSHSEFVDLFFQKSSVVENRFEFEILNSIFLKSKKDSVIIVDIDHVLADWEWSFLNFINSQCIKLYNHSEQLRSENIKLYDEIKHKFRISGIKKYMPVIKGSVQFIDKLKKAGYVIVIVTARPYETYHNLWYDTKYWLDNNKFNYDALFFENKKHQKLIKTFENLDCIKCVIDDDIDVIRSMSSIGLKTFKIDHKKINFEYILSKIL